MILFSLVLITFLSGPCNGNSRDQAQFEERVYNEILSVDTRGIPVDIILTVAKLETGNGKGSLFLSTYNLFSIHNTQTGHCVTLHNSRFTFAKYENEIESIKDFVAILSERKRYHIALRYALAHDAQAFFVALHRAGYAEDPQYPAKLERVYRELTHGQMAERFRKHKVMDDVVNHSFVNQRIYK